MGGLVSQDYVGSGDFYASSKASDQWAFIGRVMLHSTDGRVFLSTHDKVRLETWLGTIASSAGLSTVHYTTGATNGYLSVEGTIRNSHVDGAAVRVWGAGFGMYVYEQGSVVSKGANGLAIQLSVNSLNTTAHISNDGTIVGEARAIERNGSEAVSITNNGYISVLSGVTYRDTFGGMDTIRNNGVVSGRIEFGGGNDYYFGEKGRLNGGAFGGEGHDVLNGGIQGELLDGGSGIDNIRGGGGDDTIIGGADGDFLYGDDGNDTLNSAGGGDRMEGGAGNDYYHVNADDVIVEGTNGGFDTLNAHQSVVLGAGVSIERMQINDRNGTFARNLTGNELAQELIGGNGANILNGGGGVDRMEGLGGNDTYFVDNVGDIIAEAAGAVGGADTVLASVSYTLKAGVAVETLGAANYASTAAFNLAGNDLGQRLNGSKGINVLAGKGGNDLLAGALGNDKFVFDTALNASTNVDTILDFTNATGNNDTIQLENAIFTALTATGYLAASLFKANATGTATDADDRIIYETDTGKLFYDANGSAAGGATQFATIKNFASLTGSSALSASDFLVV